MCTMLARQSCWLEGVLQTRNPRRETGAGFVRLVCMSNRVFDIESRIYLLARIEDVVWVKDSFGVFEEFEDRLTEYL